MSTKIHRSIRIAPETDYEIRRLAKMWGVPIIQAWERCAHFAAAHYATIAPADLPMKLAVEIRYADAMGEMLRAELHPSA